MSTTTKGRIQLEISHNEALVLFELLADFTDQLSVVVPSAAERLALLRLHGAIERTLVDPFCSDYADLLSKARNDLSAEYGELQSER